MGFMEADGISSDQLFGTTQSNSYDSEDKRGRISLIWRAQLDPVTRDVDIINDEEKHKIRRLKNSLNDEWI